ncbi:hypothetical protein [Asaia sp. HN010]|uniref:hypothetical protein n=1 Tax=Asaia sp. HN010 TaxID=3081233 RepID=UPI00301B57A8
MQCGCAGSSLSGAQSLTGDHAYARPIASADPTDPDQNGTRTVGQTVSHYNNGHGSESITVNAKPHHPAAGLNFNYGIGATDFAQYILPPVATAASVWRTGQDIYQGQYRQAAIESALGWGLGLETGAAGMAAGKVVALGLKEIQAIAAAGREEKAAGTVLQNAAHEGESAGGSGTSAETKPNAGKDENAKPDIDRIKIGGIGSLENATFAQVKSKGGKTFSKEGIEKYSAMAGREIRTVDDLTAAIKEGKVNPSDIEINYVIVNGKAVIANTRTSTALTNAGIPPNQWNGVNVSGRVAYEDKTSDDLVRQQIDKNKGSPIKGVDWK